MKLAPEWKAPAAVAPSAGTLDARVVAFGLLAGALFWLVVFYGETWLAMVDIWRRSDTFAHGFLIVPISAWLAWQRRHVLSTLELRPGYGALPLLACAGFAWLVAGLAGAGVVQQYAVVLMVPLLVWAVLGREVLREFAFPLFFLLFAVPFGEFLERTLMEHTADFTVTALRLTGIPVYREGQFFTIPSGNWSVVEACSGLRYLIASLTVGFLYAYLTYRSFRRRAAFVAASVVVPIIANWLRAYMIVMIGHLSGMKYAVGVDHLIYGWLFFGLVMMLLFWAGSYWREDTGEGLSRDAPAARVNREPSRGAIAGVALGAALIAAVWPVAAERLESASGHEAPALQLPARAGAWEPAPAPLTSWQPRFQAPSALAEQVYASNGALAGLQIRYYRRQRPGAQLISSHNVLVASENKEWKNTGETSQPLTLGGVAVPAIEGRLKNGAGHLLVWRWYWVDGHYVSNPYWAKMLQAKSMLLGHGDDGAAVFFYAPYDLQPDGARRTLQDLAGAMLPALSTSLDHARQTGNAH